MQSNKDNPRLDEIRFTCVCGRRHDISFRTFMNDPIVIKCLCSTQVSIPLQTANNVFMYQEEVR